MEALSVEGLTKRYPAFTLSDVSFSVDEASITGFIGRNGAGKSTTLKCLEGSVHPDEGMIRYFGDPFQGNEERTKSMTGFELGSVNYYRTKRLSAIANVTRRFYADWDDQAYGRYCRQFDLDQTKRVKDLSQGMRVKFALALALSRNAKLLILDEPTSGLDPASREEVLNILLDLARNKGVAILFSTHITSDLDKCADKILYIRDGSLAFNGSMHAFKESFAIMSLSDARTRKIPILGVRRAVSGDTALVSAQAGFGTPASIDDVMTHEQGTAELTDSKKAEVEA